MGNKYKFLDKNAIKLFKKNVKGKDFQGNNTLHYAFEINDLPLRYRFLQLLLEQGIGDLHKPNDVGQLPIDIEHTIPLAKVPQ